MDVPDAAEPVAKKAPRAAVIDLDADAPAAASTEPMRYYTCHNHHTTLGSGYASTLVCARNVPSAQKALDAWLVQHNMKPLASFPYQLHEISGTSRGCTIVSFDDAVRLDTQPPNAAQNGAKNGSCQMYICQDVPLDAIKNKCVVAGAVIVASDDVDAAAMLTEALWKKELLMRNYFVAPEHVKRMVVPAVRDGHVVPLSLYMCDE